MNDKLPIYKLRVDKEDSGVDYIALVDHPAIQRNWMAFSEEKQNFYVENEDQMILSGALMIADLPIFRRSESLGEHYVIFDKETISTIVKRYFKNKFTSNVNLMHEQTAKVDGVYLFESYIINRERGIKPPKGFEGVSDGSWFGSFKVDNKEVWDDFVKTGKLKGFSVEGEFAHEPFEQKKLTDIEKIIAIIEQIKP